MDIRQLRYFLAIAEEGQITKAARRLHIAQPPLSQQLILLERELGVKLVERNGHKLKLTDAGLDLQLRAEQILYLMEAALTEMKGHNSGVRGTLSVGAVASIGATFLPEIISEFHERYPEIRFRLYQEDTKKITELLDNRTIDIGFINFPVNHAAYNIITLPPKPLIAAMSRKWSKDMGEPLCLSALKDVPLLLLRAPERRFIYEQVIDALEKIEIKPRVLCESSNIMALLILAECGMGVTIIPQASMKLCEGRNLELREISEPGLNTIAALIWPKNRYLPLAAQRFIELSSKHLSPITGSD